MLETGRESRNLCYVRHVPRPVRRRPHMGLGRLEFARSIDGRDAKTARQLDRDIAEALARSRSHHATVADEQWEPFARPDWTVILDALLEHNPKKAAEVWHQMRKDEGDSPRPDSFVRKLRDIPADVRWKFEDLTARTADRYLEAINDAIYRSKDPDALIAAVGAANKHRGAMKRRHGSSVVDSSGEFDPAAQDLGNLLVKANEMVRRIKIQRKTGRFPEPSSRTAWKLR